MKIDKNERGFAFSKFKDRSGYNCLIEKSSLATEECIWLGVDDSKLTIFDDEKMIKCINTKLPENWRVNTQMELTRKQVADLLPLLQNFVNTGNLE